MIVRCPSCQQKLNAEAGRRVRCPKCQTVFATEAEDAGVPDAVDAPEPVARPPARRLGLVAAAVAVLFVVGAGGVLIGLALGKAKGPAVKGPDSGQAAAVNARPAEVMADPQPSAPAPRPQPAAPKEQPKAADTPPAPDNKPLGRPVAFMHAWELWRAYGANEAKADLDYSGKVVELVISGKVAKDAQGNYLLGSAPEAAGVSPRTYQQMSPLEKKRYNEGYPPNILAYFGSDRLKDFANLKPGQSCVVKGICRGKRQDADVYQGYTVSLERCELVRVFPAP
jgi:hypothetical protein